ncbi:MAG: hypothetical protein K0S46_1234 [Moraxellaceae bacterium]|jgi:hypothetical protein|nr:hypothetical protein [Moraxellaceae bacterium]
MTSGYEASSPEMRYQVSEQRGKSTRFSQRTKTFSMLAPVGYWNVLGPHPRGAISFLGFDGPYVSHQVEFSLTSKNDGYKKDALIHLKKGDPEGRIEELLNNPKYDRPDPPPRPRNMKARVVNFRGYKCVAYEHDIHQGPDADPRIGGKWAGQGSEEYFSSLSCDGFLNGVQGRFLITSYTVVSDRRVKDGVNVDVEALKRDLEERLQRSKDSIEFNGEFTQVVPPGL